MQNPSPNSSASLIYQQQQVNHDQEQHYHHIPPTTSHLNYNHYQNQHQLQAQELYASAQQPQPQEELYSTFNGDASSYETHVLYNNNHQEILYHESGFVINGSNGVSNHLNSSLSASQTSLPPPPAPADLHDMMMLNNASLLAANGHNNHANANNHNSHYYAPQQHQQLQQQGHALRTNGGDDIYGEGLCMVDGGVHGDDNDPETMTVSTRNATCNYQCLLCLSACACFNVLITLLSSE